MARLELLLRAAVTTALAAGCAALTGLDEIEAIPGTGTENVEDGSTSRDGADDRERYVDGATESGADASADADAGFCTGLPDPKPTLCVDYDDVAFPGTFTNGSTGTGTATAVTSPFFSAPRAMRLAVGGGTGSAFMHRSFAKVPDTALVIAFRVRVDQFVMATHHELAIIRLGTAGATGKAYELQLEVSSTGLNLEEETPLADGAVPERDIPLGIVLPSATYARVTMTLSFGATSKVSVDVDGVKKDVDVSAQLYKAAPTIVLGYDSSSTQPSTIYFDDVIVDVR